jgi:hypothetical protein
MIAPQDIRVVASDAALATCEQTDFVSLTGGDLFRSLGSPVKVPKGAECTCVHIDALECEVFARDNTVETLLASSAVLVGTWWSRGGCTWLTNGGLIDSHDVAPRAHPNDGKVDVLEMDSHMPFRQKFLAHRRMRTGTHVPHPNLRLARTEEITIRRTSARQSLRIDGVARPDWSHLRCSVRPDYWQILL